MSNAYKIMKHKETLNDDGSTMHSWAFYNESEKTWGDFKDATVYKHKSRKLPRGATWFLYVDITPNPNRTAYEKPNGHGVIYANDLRSYEGRYARNEFLVFLRKHYPEAVAVNEPTLGAYTYYYDCAECSTDIANAIAKFIPD